MSVPPYGTAPRWVAVVIIILMLPVFAFPALLSALPPDDSSIRTIAWCYPFYVLLSGYLAWQCYPQRPAMSWILLVLMVMSHAAMWILVNGNVI